MKKDFNWQNIKVKALGVWLSADPEITTKLNFFEKNRKKCGTAWAAGQFVD